MCLTGALHPGAAQPRRRDRLGCALRRRPDRKDRDPGYETGQPSPLRRQAIVVSHATKHGYSDYRTAT